MGEVQNEVVEIVRRAKTMSATEISKDLDVPVNRVRAVLASAGFKIREVDKGEYDRRMTNALGKAHRAKRKPRNPERDALIVEMYERGDPLHTIREAVGASNDALIYNVLRRKGVTPDRSKGGADWVNRQTRPDAVSKLGPEGFKLLCLLAMEGKTYGEIADGLIAAGHIKASTDDAAVAVAVTLNAMQGRARQAAMHQQDNASKS